MTATSRRLHVGADSLINPQRLVDSGVVTGVKDTCVSGNSIDLCIKDVYEITNGIVLHNDGSRVLPEYHRRYPVDLILVGSQKRAYWPFLAGHLYQVEFEERVELPENVTGLTLMRSSMYKSGASGEPGLFDAGYCGSTGMSVSTKFTSHVEVGGSIAQMIFLQSNSAKIYDGYYANDEWMRVTR